MSIDLNSIKAGQDAWWKPNLFPNGDFSVDERSTYTIGGNMPYLPPNIDDVYPIIGNKILWQNRPTDTSRQPYIRFPEINCKPLTIYTLSWWERQVAPVGTLSSNCIVLFSTIGFLPINYDVNYNRKFNRVSVTFTTPENCTFLRVQLGNRITNNSHVHCAYDGIYLCEGDYTPYHWVDNIDRINTPEDFVYPQIRNYSPFINN